MEGKLDWYVLDREGNPKPADVLDAARWAHQGAERRVEDGGRIVGYDELPGGVSVSTVFLGLDHRTRSEGPPVLFETMIFGGEYDDYQERYCALSEAREGHARALSLAKGESHDR